MLSIPGMTGDSLAVNWSTSVDKHKDNLKITILIGGRQVGKTTLLRALYSSVEQLNHSLFLDMDLYSNFEKISTYDNLITTLIETVIPTALTTSSQIGSG